MTRALSEEMPERTWRRWFTFLGGGIAWVMHLLSIYAVGEFGCVSGLGRVSYAGVSAVAWLIILISAILLAVAVAAAFLGYQDKGRDNEGEFTCRENEGGRFLSRFGFLLSGLFALIILVETLPVFAYLDGC